LKRLLASMLVLSISGSMRPAFSAPPASAQEKKACAAASEKAQSLRSEGKMISARELLLVCARDVCPTVVRKDCSRWVAEVDEALPSIVVAAKDESGHDVTDAKVFVDDQPFSDTLDGKSQPIDPGAHVVRLERQGKQVTEKVLIREGEKNRIVLIHLGPQPKEGGPPPPPPKDKPIPAETWILGGVGVVGLVGFVGFGLSARGQASDLRSSCAPACAQSDVDSVKKKALFADVSLGIGLVALGAATYFYLTTSNEKDATKVGFAPLSGGGALSVAGHF
jgi:hypothetical protein